MKNIDIRIYKDFDDDKLLSNWHKLYSQGGNYNLSPIWCKTWFKYFGRNKKKFIITLWQENELCLLAPLYKEKSVLKLIGTDPDLFDEFGILYKNVTYLKFFLDYIFKSELNVDFRFLNSESIVAKLLLKKIYQEKIEYNSLVIDTKPYILPPLSLKKSLREDIKRCKNRIKKNTGNNVVFKYKTKINEHIINEFIDFHKKRWDGGPFESLNGYQEFITDLCFNSDLVLLSRLHLENSTQTIGYHLGYLGSNGCFTSSVPAYNKDYADVSPGKILLHDLIEVSLNIENHCKTFDFGRGGEAYKYWFANKDIILFNVQTKKSRVKKEKSRLEKIKNVFKKLRV